MQGEAFGVKGLWLCQDSVALRAYGSVPTVPFLMASAIGVIVG